MPLVVEEGSYMGRDVAHPGEHVPRPQIVSDHRDSYENPCTELRFETLNP
jgi:hypothetical protein